MKVKVNESKTLKVKNKKVSGIDFMGNGLTNPDFVAADGTSWGMVGDRNKRLDFYKVAVKAVLKREVSKTSHTLVSGYLGRLGSMSTYGSTLYHFARYQDDWFEKGPGGANGILIPSRITFPPIDLSGDDELEITVHITGNDFLGKSPYTSAVTGENIPYSHRESYIDFREIDCHSHNVEYVTPYIHEHVVEPSQSDIEKSLGNNITEIHIFSNHGIAELLNFGGGYQLDDSVRVLDSATLASLQLDYTKYSEQMFTEKLTTFESEADMNDHANHYVLYNGDDIDEVTLNLRFNQPNVIGGDTILMYRTYYTDIRLINEANTKSEKVRDFNTRKVRQKGRV
jgi:hypothetical protein